MLSRYSDRQQDHQRGQELDTLVLAFFESLSQEDLAGPLGAEFVLVLIRLFQSITPLPPKTLQIPKKSATLTYTTIHTHM